MKKIIISMIIAMMLFSITGCSNNEVTDEVTEEKEVEALEDDVIKNDIVTYISEVLNEQAKINSFTRVSNEYVDEELTVTCDVVYDGNEERKQGQFVLIYMVNEENEWELSKCRVDLDIVYDPESMYKIILTPDENITVKGYNSAIDILKERLNIFANGEDYQMNMLEDSMELILPKTLFGELDVNNVLQAYITRPTELYLRNTSTSPIVVEAIEIKRKDISNVESKFGTIEGLDVSKYGIEQGEYPYVEITLSDNWMEKNKEDVTKWGENISFIQDVAESTKYEFVAVPSDTVGKYYIVDSEFNETLVKLMAYNFLHESYEKGFDYEIEKPIEWEKIENTEIVGKNQCNAKELTDPTVTFSYKYKSEYVSSGELLDVKTVLKERLDALEQPYSFAVQDSEDIGYQEIVIKTGIEHMGMPIMNILGEYGVNIGIRSGLVNESLSTSSVKFSSIDNQDGTYSVVLEADDAEKKNIENLTQKMLDEEQNELIFVLYEVPFFKATVDSVITDGKIVFSDICYSDTGKITEENLWLVKLIEMICTQKSLTESFILHSHEINADGLEKDSLKYGVSNSNEDTKMIEKLQQIVPEAKIVITEDNKIALLLNLDVDDTLPKQSVSLAKELYSASELENNPYYTGISFYLIEEDDTQKERARIFLTKCFGTLEEDGYVEAYGIFANGRMEKYKEKIVDILEDDKFFKEHARKDEFLAFPTWQTEME